MAEIMTLARPYAQAVFALARTDGDRRRWSETLALASVIVGDPRVARLALDPRITPERLLALLCEIGGSRFDDQAGVFLRLLVGNERLPLLPEIGRIFETLRREAEHSVEIEVTSAHALSPAQEVEMRERLERRLERRVVLRARVDAGLVAGTVVRFGDRVIDGSLRARLTAFATYLN